VTPIGLILSNPSAFHRKALKLEGIAKDVEPYSGYEAATRRPICGADFKLEDDTGEIKVHYHAWCAAGEEQASTVVEGSRVIVEGSMEGHRHFSERTMGTLSSLDSSPSRSFQ
jgi:hypothetical protein